MVSPVSSDQLYNLVAHPVGKKGSSRLHRGKNPAFAFDTQILLDAAHLSEQTNQHFRLVRIELICDKDPARLRISLDSLGNMSSKVGFSARWSQAWRDHLTGSHIQIGNHTQGAVPVVFEF